ncbi:protein UBASH3A homolog [Homarus americanus]|uniref:protein UBASH3A homolog n=1 Tax=Homarus americanus TaxID=6706 RepID=UPI001C495E77|nr:protein UBASH3A homolog [Homarus americanus]
MTDTDVKKPKKEGPLYKFPIEGPRKIIVVRHGERVDFTFGDWIRFCFNEAGTYQRRDLNMPETLPQRKGAPHSFYKDCPLTNIGLLQASLVGQAMKANGTEVHHVFCSPSLRCVQTCTNILKGMGIAEHLPLNIEPGLFEWLAWYHDGMPLWMTLDELIDAGFNINHNYDPLIRKEELKDTHESCEQYYGRNAYVTQSIINTTQSQGGTVLLVGHAATLDTCTRQLIGGAPRSAHEMTTIIKKIPYCSTSAVLEWPSGHWSLVQPVLPVSNTGQAHYDWRILLIPYCSFAFAAQDTKGSWSLEEPPIPPATHSANMRYDWRILVS